MQRETIQITDKEQWLNLRKIDVTSTDVCVLFGEERYKTYYQLWCEKHQGKEVPFEENERVRAGKYLEKAIAELICADFDLGSCKHMGDIYMRLPDRRVGSSFDFVLDSGAILEIKSVDAWEFKQHWSSDAVFDVVPMHIEYQVQTQMLVSGITTCYIGVLVGGNQTYLFKRDYDENIGGAILREASKFWEKTSAPKPDYQADSEFIIANTQYAQPGKVVDIDDSMLDLLKLYDELGDIEKNAYKERQGVKARLLEAMGDAEKAKGMGYTISAGLVGPKTITTNRKGYRSFRVTKSK